MGDRLHGRRGRWGQIGLSGLLVWSIWFFCAPQSSRAQTLSNAGATTVASNSIEGRVWKDGNRDGLYQLDEPFLPYTVVALYKLTSTAPQTPQLSTTPLLTTTTTITGSYAFQGVPAGAYVVEFITRGSMYPTNPKQGADEANDSDIATTGTVAYGRSAVLSLVNGGAGWRIDAGFIPAAQATIYVYHDDNRDNTRQVGEPVVLGAVVILHDNQGREVSRRVVDQRGAALFPDLAPGDYTVTIWPPDGYAEDPHGAVALPLSPGATVRLSAPVAAAPKVVDLTAFSIDIADDELIIRWVTALEQETYGYRLLRRQDIVAAAREQLTTAMILSQGTQGGIYEVRLPYRPAYDGPATAMEFWLVEYEITGKENRYGPFYVTQPAAPNLFLPLIVQAGPK